MLPFNKLLPFYIQEKIASVKHSSLFLSKFCRNGGTFFETGFDIFCHLCLVNMKRWLLTILKLENYKEKGLAAMTFGN